MNNDAEVGNEKGQPLHASALDARSHALNCRMLLDGAAKAERINMDRASIAFDSALGTAYAYETTYRREKIVKAALDYDAAKMRLKLIREAQDHAVNLVGALNAYGNASL